MIVGIDASNLRGGGGVTHLVELLRAADPNAHGLTQVVVWGGKGTLGLIDDRSWLVKRHDKCLDNALPSRLLWQRGALGRQARTAGCDVLFVPGGTYIGNFRPFITMCRNMLPFEWTELRRYRYSKIVLKLLLLRLTQSLTFKRADGLIFLSEYAKKTILGVIKVHQGKYVSISHGIDTRFSRKPSDKSTKTYSTNQPVHILYVSHIEQYKHQWMVVEAVASLRKENFPVMLDLVGPRGNAIEMLRDALKRFDPRREFVRYRGTIPHTEIHTYYQQADLFLFASSCENMPNILLEAMASGLPIACSNRGPMPEVLEDAGIYFEPEDPKEIAAAVRTLIEDVELRGKKASAAFELSKRYSWKRCAEETFSFLSSIARR